MDGIIINAEGQSGLSPRYIAQEPGDAEDIVVSQRAITELMRLGPEVRADIVKPTQRKERLTYTGRPIIPAFNGFNVDCMEISGTTSAVTAGTYEANFTLKPGCIWEDGTTDPIAVRWSIEKAPGVCLLSPAAVTVMSDSSETVTVKCLENAQITVTSDKPAVAGVAMAEGEFTVLGKGHGSAVLTVTAGETTNYESVEVQLPVSVVETVAVPEQKGVLHYDGSEKTPVWYDYAATIMDLDGTLSAIDAGVYEATFRLIKDGYCWEDGSRGAKTVRWTILRGITRDVPVQSGRLAYTGSEQTAAWYGDTAGLTIGGTTKATDAGTYTATFTPNPNWEWNDGTQGMRYAVWSIEKGAGTLTMSAFRGTVDKGHSTTFTVTTYANTPIIVQSQNPNIALASVTNTATANGTTTSTITITGGTTAGETVLTVLAGETSNRTSKTDTFAITSYLGTLAAPVIRNNTRTYDGSTQSVPWEGFNAATMVSGGTISAVNAGSYSATVTPKAGYRWQNGRTDTRTVKWGISKTAGTCTLSSRSGTVDKGKTVQFTVTTHASANIKATSGNTGIATVSVSGNKVTITGGNNAGNATITVTAEETSNHNAASSTYTITNYLASLTIPTTAARTYNASSQTPNWSNLDTAKMTTGGTTSATNAGTYSATVTPKSGYRWTDGTTSQKTISWNINKANGYISRSDTQKTWANVEQGQTLTYTFNMHPGATLSATSSENTNVYTVSTSGNELRIRGGNTFGANGYKITVTAGATANYNAASMTCAATNWVGSTPVPVMGSNRTYNGSAQSPNWTTLNSSITVLSGTTSSTNAGTYTVKTTPKSGYRWAGTVDSTVEKSYGWSINRANGTCTLPSTSGTVDKGKTVQLTVTTHASAAVTATSGNTGIATVSVSGNKVTITGGNNAGNATITVTAGQTTNHNAASSTYTITNYLASLTIPTTAARTYNASSQSPNWSNLDTAKMTTGGTTSATNAGTYSATVTPKSGYRWTDGTTSQKTVSWTINKANGSCTLSSTSGTTSRGNKVQITASGHTGATFSATSSNTGYATVAVSGSTITITGGNSNGTATITVKANATTNYNEASKTYSVTNYTETINVPTTTNRTYTGSEQTPNWSGLDTGKMTTGGTLKATNAGTYTATVTPKAGYAWSDGSTGAKNVSWTINKANGILTFPDDGVYAVNKNETFSVTATSHPGAKITLGTYDTKMVTISVSGNTLTATGGSEPGTNLIGVDASETTNHKKAHEAVVINNYLGTLDIPKPSPAEIDYGNGLQRSPVWIPSNWSSQGITASGDTKGAGPGLYTTYFTLPYGYRWTDGTTDQKSVHWWIKRIPTTLKTLYTSTTDFTCQAGETIIVDLQYYNKSSGQLIWYYPSHSLTLYYHPLPEGHSGWDYIQIVTKPGYTGPQYIRMQDPGDERYSGAILELTVYLT